MTTTEIDFQVQLGEILAASGHGKLIPPFMSPADPTEVDLLTFGISSPGDAFRTGWQVTMEDTSNSRFGVAFYTGSIRFEEDAVAGTNRIILVNGDALGSYLWLKDLPDWMPFPEYVIYEGIDSTETNAQLQLYLEANIEVVDALLDMHDTPYDEGSGLTRVEYLLEEFFSGSLAGIPVPAGQVVAVAAPTSDPLVRKLSIFMQQELDDPAGTYLDPGFFLSVLDVEGLAEHPLREQMSRPFAGPFGNGVVRYVASSGGTSGDFTDPTAPAKLLSSALASSNDNDTIVFLDADTYEESATIEITRPVSITSLSTDSACDASSPSFPALSGGSERRVIKIDGTTIGADDTGNSWKQIISISNLAIADGSVLADVPIHSSGLWVRRHHPTIVRNCYVHNNVSANGTSRDPFYDVGVYGGGISLEYSSALIVACRIEGNIATSNGGGMSFFGSGWPVVRDNLIKNNQARHDGGAIYCIVAVAGASSWWGPFWDEWAFEDETIEYAKNRHLIIINNDLNGNSADDDGGGIYLTALAQARLRGNQISENRAGGSGGGIRATFAAHLYLEEDVIQGNESNTFGLPLGEEDANGDEITGVMGGGVAIRDASLQCVNTKIESNTAQGWAGGGLSFVATDEGTQYSFWIIPSLDCNEVLRDVFGCESISLTVLGTAASINGNRCTRTVGQKSDHRKGGGLYALRYKATLFEAVPFSIYFEDFATVDANSLELNSGITGDSIEYPNASDLYIDDQVDREDDPIDVSNSSNWQQGSEFTYPSN